MQVDEKLIDKIAALAKLEFDKDSKIKMVSDMKKIISFVDKLNELDTENVEPLVYITEKKNVLRDDNIGEHVEKKEALKNAPEKDSDYFKVPKVVKK